MARPRITFDMDGVLCRPPFGINPGSRMDKRRDEPGTKSLLWLTERWRYIGRRPMPGAMSGFESLAEAFDCVVVTARSEVVRGLTERWFLRHLGRVPEIRMRPSWRETSAQFKARLVRELEPVAHMEDDPFTAAWVADLGRPVYVIDWPRNRGLTGDRIERVGSVAEAARRLLGDPRVS